MISTIMKAANQAIDNTSPVSLSEGEVISAPPNLKIKLNKNSKLIIPGQLIVIPENLTDHEEICDLNCNQVTTDSGTFTNVVALDAKVKRKNSLKIGDRVMVLSFEGGQKFYVLDRIGV